MSASDSASERPRRQRIPEKIGGFPPARQIGQGWHGARFPRPSGIGRTRYRAESTPPHLAREPHRLTQFRREARAMAAISHPQVVTCIDQGCDDGWHWIAMEMIGGGDLKRLRHDLGGECQNDWHSL